jgi:hypothetical protein
MGAGFLVRGVEVGGLAAITGSMPSCRLINDVVDTTDIDVYIHQIVQFPLFRVLAVIVFPVARNESEVKES